MAQPAHHWLDEYRDRFPDAPAISRSPPVAPDGDHFFTLTSDPDETRAVEEDADGRKTVRGQIITSERIDRAGDIVRMRGLDASEHRRNPVVLFNHWPDFTVARSLKISPATSRTGQPAKAADWRFGKSALAQEKAEEWGETIFATSIGFRIKRDKQGRPAVRPIDVDGEMVDRNDEDFWERVNGLEFLKTELLEYSIVSVPANPDAVGRMVKSADMQAMYGRRGRSMATVPDIGAASEMGVLETDIRTLSDTIVTLHQSVASAAEEIAGIAEQLAAVKTAPTSPAPASTAPVRTQRNVLEPGDYAAALDFINP